MSAHTAAAHTVALADTFTTVQSGALLFAAPIAAAAGLLSFFSPCVLPLVPGYLSYVTGFSAADLADARGARRGRMLAGAGLFVLGFTAVFVSTGALFGQFGDTLQQHQRIISIVLGSVTVVMGLAFMGLVPGLSMREVRSHRRPAIGLLGAPLLGVVFGVGWTPCIGPTLSAVQTLAMNQADAARGALLMTFYCLGLGLPFILAALAFRRALGAFGWVKRHYPLVMRIGGGMLVVVGLLLVTGAWDAMVSDMQSWTGDFQIGI
ncbi:cytochrome c biogenesis CcdA family protein [Kitasatospora sp. NPDC101183]|uniref:cytochrome c biogenesis CcdA family protein n=1 Tax=Kitasatospora sp. NPDC101183 TaxID=3364100 RepID=UPI0037F72E1E